MTTVFFYHLKELKKCIFLIFIFYFISLFIIYLFGDQCIYILIKPLLFLIPTKYFILTNITEIFYIKLLLTFILSSIFTSWFFFIEFYFFLSPGLLKSENIKIMIIIFVFTLNFFINNYCMYNLLIPNIWNFLLVFQENSYNYLYNLSFEPRLLDYLYLVIDVIFWVNLLFQYPLILFSLIFFKFLNINIIVKHRKKLYFILLCIATFFSSPDVFSQVFIYFFMIFFLEIYFCIFYIIKNF